MVSVHGVFTSCREVASDQVTFGPGKHLGYPTGIAELSGSDPPLVTDQIDFVHFLVRLYKRSEHRVGPAETVGAGQAELGSFGKKREVK